jgi:hypothetical protein
MKMHKEHIWLGIAFLSFLFFFERSDTLIVQDGQVWVNQRRWWFDEKKTRTINASSIASVTHEAVGSGGGFANFLLLKDKKGSVFYELKYGGFTIKQNWGGEAIRDEEKCRRAIAGNGKFSREVQKILPIPPLVFFISLVVYWYKRSWRLERERQAKLSSKNNNYASRSIQRQLPKHFSKDICSKKKIIIRKGAVHSVKRRSAKSDKTSEKCGCDTGKGGDDAREFCR